MESASSNNTDPHENSTLYKTGTVEIGIEDGEGYITATPTGREQFQFTVPTEQVRLFARKLKEEPPLPEGPEGFRETVEGPEKWDGGHPYHTGGGIFARLWTRQLDVDGQTVIAEVGYPIPECNMVGVNLRGEQREWLGEVTAESQPSKYQTDGDCAARAQELMEKVDAGDFHEKIQDLCP